MPNIYVNDAGTLRRAKGVYVNDAGTLRTISKAYVNDAGTLRLIYAAVGADDFSISFDDLTPNDVYAGFRIGGNSGGSQGMFQQVTGNSLAGASLFNSPAWISAASDAGNYDIMVEQISGTISVDTGTGPASLSTWINMNRATTGTFYVFRTNNGAGTASGVARVSFRPAGGGATLDTCDITLSATVDP